MQKAVTPAMLGISSSEYAVTNEVLNTGAAKRCQSSETRTPISLRNAEVSELMEISIAFLEAEICASAYPRSLSLQRLRKPPSVF